MYQGLRPAVKEPEASVAIITPSSEGIGALAQKFDSINVDNVFIQANSSIEENLKSLAPDVVVIYAYDDNAFLFNSILTIKNKYKMPTLVISRDYDEFVAVLAFELGADEYLPSQVGANELRLRLLRLCKKVGSRKVSQPTESIPKATVDDAALANLNRSAFSRDRAIYYSFFTPFEFEVLLLLVSSAGKALARETISLAVRGKSTNKMDRSIDNLVARVRKKLLQLGFSKYLIRGFHSFGYIFTGDGRQFLEELEAAIKTKENGV